MNTDPQNTNTRSGHQLHPEQAVPDTNTRKLYEIELFLNEYSRAVVNITASSSAEAVAKAESLSIEDVDNWQFLDSDIQTGDIETVDEGNGDE